MIPQIIYLSLIIFGLFHAIYKYGDLRDVVNFWTSVFAVFVAFGLLYWGGFFNVFFS